MTVEGTTGYPPVGTRADSTPVWRYRMAKFVMLTTLTDEGRKTLRDKPERLREVNREVEAMGAKISLEHGNVVARMVLTSS